jgi:hypothetical protein
VQRVVCNTSAKLSLQRRCLSRGRMSVLRSVTGHISQVRGAPVWPLQRTASLDRSAGRCQAPRPPGASSFDPRNPACTERLPCRHRVSSDRQWGCAACWGLALSGLSKTDVRLAKSDADINVVHAQVVEFNNVLYDLLALALPRAVFEVTSGWQHKLIEHEVIELVLTLKPVLCQALGVWGQSMRAFRYVCSVQCHAPLLHSGTSLHY